MPKKDEMQSTLEQQPTKEQEVKQELKNNNKKNTLMKHNTLAGNNVVSNARKLAGQGLISYSTKTTKSKVFTGLYGQRR